MLQNQKKKKRGWGREREKRLQKEKQSKVMPTFIWGMKYINVHRHISFNLVSLNERLDIIYIIFVEKFRDLLSILHELGYLLIF